MAITNIRGIVATSMMSVGQMLNKSDSTSVGSAYSLTNSSAALDFGTTDPSVILDEPGTYLIFARADINYAASTFLAVRDVTLKLRRTNNTAEDLTNAAIVLKTDIITTLTYSFANPCWWAVYTTANSDDIITIFGDVSVVPSAGALSVINASLVAIKIA